MLRALPIDDLHHIHHFLYVATEDMVKFFFILINGCYFCIIFSYEELLSCWSIDPATRPDSTSLLDYFEFEAQSEDPLMPANRVQITII